MSRLQLDPTTAVREVLLGSREWLRRTYRAVREDGWDGARDSARLFHTGLWQLAGLVANYGTPIYEREWDVLVVLDACRADLLAEVADDYAFLSRQTAESVGSVSPEWMEKNFTARYAEEMAHTAHVTGNLFSQYCLDPDDFLLLDEVWRYGWDDDLGTVLPDVVTDRAVRAHRAYDPDQLIVHYMQPHHPFVPEPLDDGIDLHGGREGLRNSEAVWVRLRRGEVNLPEVWDAYRQNLAYVLEYVEVLLGSIDAGTVVVTADHGNAVGEHGMYGHPKYAPIEALKRVPWCVTTARDEGALEQSGIEPVAAADSTSPDTDDDVEQKLEALGYL